MKYIINKFTTIEKEFVSINTTSDDINFISFHAIVGNSNYDAFLEQTGLTDEEVHALPVDEWIEA